MDVGLAIGAVLAFLGYAGLMYDWARLSDDTVYRRPNVDAHAEVRTLNGVSDEDANTVAFKAVANSSISDAVRIEALKMLHARELPYRERAIQLALVHGGPELIAAVAELLDDSCSHERLNFVREYVDRTAGLAAVPILRVLAAHATSEDEDRLLALTRGARSEVVEIGASALGRMGSARCIGPLSVAMSDGSAGRPAKNALRDAIAEIQERVGSVGGGLAIAEPVGMRGGLAVSVSAEDLHE